MLSLVCFDFFSKKKRWLVCCESESLSQRGSRARLHRSKLNGHRRPPNDRRERMAHVPQPPTGPPPPGQKRVDAGPEVALAQMHLSDPNSPTFAGWFYLDAQGLRQGPFSLEQLRGWLQYLPADLLVRNLFPPKHRRCTIVTILLTQAYGDK